MGVGELSFVIALIVFYGSTIASAITLTVLV